jgi:hypothetical protein
VTGLVAMAAAATHMLTVAMELALALGTARDTHFLVHRTAASAASLRYLCAYAHLGMYRGPVFWCVPLARDGGVAHVYGGVSTLGSLHGQRPRPPPVQSAVPTRPMRD